MVKWVYNKIVVKVNQINWWICREETFNIPLPDKVNEETTPRDQYLMCDHILKRCIQKRYEYKESTNYA